VYYYGINGKQFPPQVNVYLILNRFFLFNFISVVFSLTSFEEWVLSLNKIFWNNNAVIRFSASHQDTKIAKGKKHEKRENEKRDINIRNWKFSIVDVSILLVHLRKS